MDYIVGSPLAVGIVDAIIDDSLEQRKTLKQLGELKEVKGINGAIVSVYSVGIGEELSFEALVEDSVADKNIGDAITLDNKTYYVTDWTVIESNEDAKRVSCTARNYDGLVQRTNGTSA